MKTMNRKYYIFTTGLFILLSLLVITVIRDFTLENGDGEDIMEARAVPFVNIPHNHLSEELYNWVEESRDTFLAQDRVLGDVQYILVTYGEKPSGGYDVSIAE